MTGEQFKSVRESLNLKQSALADLLGISTRQIIYLEKGEKPIDGATARAMAWLAQNGIEYPWRNYGLIK